MAKSERVVIDTSVFLALVLPEKPERRAYADAVLDAVETGRADVLIPDFCKVEAMGRLVRVMRSGKVEGLTPQKVKAFAQAMDGMQLEVSVVVQPFRQLFDQAGEWGCQVADSVFVRLALDARASLATLDGGMRQACVVAGVPLFEGATQ